MNEDEHIVICTRATDSWFIHMMARCHICGEVVGISEDTAKQIEHLEKKIYMCMNCFVTTDHVKSILEGKGKVMTTPDNGPIDKIIAVLRRRMEDEQMDT